MERLVENADGRRKKMKQETKNRIYIAICLFNYLTGVFLIMWLFLIMPFSTTTISSLALMMIINGIFTLKSIKKKGD